ncbi:MAG TPA: hypothetical protein VFP71_11210 [Candidatus Angelobacter sp.]|nr:hypothetical protein [Candidatus Angelobacter sp.]
MEVNDLFSYWKDYPPTHILMAAFLTGGKKSLAGKTTKPINKTNFDDLTQAVVVAGGSTGTRLPPIYKA